MNGNVQKAPLNALEEVCLTEHVTSNGVTVRCWDAYLRKIAATFPDEPVVIDDLLDWNFDWVLGGSGGTW